MIRFNHIPRVERASLFLIIALLGSAGLAQAQEANGQRGAAFMKQRWDTVDKNKDGKITKDELRGPLAANFDKFDTNGDGAIEKSELEKLLGGGNAPQRNANANANRRNTATPNDEQLVKMAPEGVTVIPSIKYREGDSDSWQLDLAMPTAKSDKPRPAIVFIHGGGWTSGDKRSGYFLSGALEYAKKGYVCITVNYRFTQEAPFPACIEDCKCAVRWLRANAEKYNIDPDRIGGYGNSAGAHLVAMLGLAGKDAGLEGDGPYQDQSSMLNAVCSSATPTDFSLFGARSRMADNLELGKKCSPVTYVTADAPPFLVVHGTADTTVDVKHGDTFVEALKKAGNKDVFYIRIEGSGHGVFGQNAERTHPAMEKFFARALAAKASAEK